LENGEKLDPARERVGGHYVIPIPDRFDEPKIDYRAIFGVFLRQRWLFAVCLFGCIAIFLALTLLLPRKYEASTLLVSVAETPESSSLSTLASEFGGLASMAGIDFGQSSNTAEAVAILGSQGLAMAFIRENDLMPVIFEDLWNSELGEWTVSGDKIPSTWDAVNRFSKDIRKVNLRKDDGLIKLSITWKDPEVAAAWATELVALANRVMREDAVLEANKSLAYLEQRLADTSSLELQQGIYRLIESYLKRIMIASVRDEYAFKVIDEAVAPDRDDYSSPNLLVFMLLGAFVGMTVGVIAALWRDRRVRGLSPTGSDEQA